MRIAFVCVALAVATLAAKGQGVVDLAGKPADPLKESHGKTAVLLFVRTDCPISNRYAPVIQEMSRKYAGEVAFWLVYPGKIQTPADIQTQMTRYGYHLPAVRDLEHQLIGESQVEVTPEAAVFDKNGRLVYHGRIDNWYEDFGRARSTATTHELDDAIHATLRGETPKVTATAGIGCSLADLE